MSNAPKLLQRSERYLRQLALPGFGAEQQRSLANARVLVIGAGGLGSSVLPALAAAGVGTVTVIDADIVEESNLHRQLIHTTPDIGRLKVDSAADRLRAMNPTITIAPLAARFDRSNALDLLSDHDLVIDGSDNFATRYLANDAAALAGIPLVWGAVSQYGGQAGACWAPKGPSYRDLFPTPPAPGSVLSCAVGGVLSTVCAVIGSLMATEAIKLITDLGRPLLGRVTSYDALTGGFRELAFEADPDAEPIIELIDYDMFCGVTPAASQERDTVSDEQPTQTELTPAELSDLLTDGDPVQLIDVREPWEAEIAAIPGARLIPLGTLADNLASLDPAIPVVAYCHSGVRSGYALQTLLGSGFDAKHLVGGIDAWSRVVDPSVPRY